MMGNTKSTTAELSNGAALTGNEYWMPSSENKPEDECNTSNIHGIPDIVDDENLDVQDDHNTEAEQNIVILPPSQKKPKLKFTNCDFFLLVFSIATTLLDVGSDIYLAVHHGRNGNYYWFAFTLFFVFTPCLVQGFYSLMFWCTKRPHAHITTMNIVIKIIPGGPVVGYINIFIMGCQYRKKPSKQLARKIVLKNSKIAFVRHSEAFIEAAPQLVLQLYILLDNPNSLDYQTVAAQLVTVITSLAALSWSSVSMYKSWVMRRKSEKVSPLGLALIFVWNTFTISARVLSLVLFAISARNGVFILTGIHFIIMLVWHLMLKGYKLGHIDCYDFTGSLVKAFVMIFSLCDRFSFTYMRLANAFFYLLMYIENSVMLLVWYYTAETSPKWLCYFAFTLIVGLYWVGITCQVIYYIHFHPNNSDKNQANHIKAWVPLSELACIRRRPSDKKVNELKALMSQHVSGLSDDKIDDTHEEIILWLSCYRGEELNNKTQSILKKVKQQYSTAV